MRRPNTRIDDLNTLLEQLSYENVEAAIEEYLAADDLDDWMAELQTGPSRRYFLIWQGEPLHAKAIGKAALRANQHRFRDWHTDPIIDALEIIGFAIWDLANEQNGDFNREAALVYETTRRLARPGQQRFRQDALRLWGNRCAISGENPDVVLEAAHIVPHTEGGEMSARNSIILRADLHRLFDAGLMAIEPTNLEVMLHETAKDSYREFANRRIVLPAGGPILQDFTTRWQRWNGGT